MQSAVAKYYDKLDEKFAGAREVHVHHGLWFRGDESRAAAKDNLALWVGQKLGLREGLKCIDLGSGYGATARLLAIVHGVSVDAITISEAQHHGSLGCGTIFGVRYFCGDWLENDFSSETYDAIWAIESIEHLPDIIVCLSECGRVLRPGGSLLIACWTQHDGVQKTARKLLLDPIGTELNIVLRTQSELKRCLGLAGFEECKVYDLTAFVARTWNPTIAGTLRDLRALFGLGGLRTQALLEPGLNWRTSRIALAYRMGVLRYTAFVTHKVVFAK